MGRAKAKATKKGGKKPPGDDRPKGVEMDFKIEDLSFSPETQPRAGEECPQGINGEHVEDIRAAVRAKKTLPRVRVWRVAGKGNFITDGHHTTEAYRLEGRKTVPAEVFEGEWWEAVADASSANAHEGAALKATHADKRRAVANVLKALKDAGKNWSNGRVAKHCRVSDDLVGKMLAKTPSLKPSGPKEGLDGKKYVRSGGDKKAATPKPEPEPKADLKAVDPIAASVVAQAVAEVKPKPAAEPVRTFDFAAFEGKVGAVDRDIDTLAGMFGVMHTPRTEGIRKHLRSFKAAFAEWHKELGEKARVK